MSWNTGRLCVFASVQVLWWWTMEVERDFNFNVMSWYRFRRVFHSQLCALDQRKFSVDSIPHPFSTSRSLVWNFRPVDFRWRIFRIPKKANWTSRPDQPNPPPSAWPKLVHTTDTRHRDGRRFAIWMHFYPAILHFELDLVQSNVLHVRIPLPRLHHLGHHLFGNYSSSLLFPLVRWGLSLVVA